jgi:hypothetical protein
MPRPPHQHTKTTTGVVCLERNGVHAGQLVVCLERNGVHAGQLASELREQFDEKHVDDHVGDALKDVGVVK